MRLKINKLIKYNNLLNIWNFRNNQNYVLSKKTKNKAIQYAYNSNKWVYWMYNLNNRKLRRKLDIQETAYIIDTFGFKKNLYFLYSIFIPSIFLFVGIKILIEWWTLSKTTTIMWKTTYQEVILDNLSLLDRFFELWLFFLIPFILYLFIFWILYYRKRFYKNHIVFIDKIKDNKIYLHRYK